MTLRIIWMSDVFFAGRSSIAGDFLKGRLAAIRWHQTAWGGRGGGGGTGTDYTSRRSHWTFTAGGMTFVMYSRLAHESCSKFVTASRNRDLHKSSWQARVWISCKVYFHREERNCIQASYFPKAQFPNNLSVVWFLIQNLVQDQIILFLYKISKSW